MSEDYTFSCPRCGNEVKSSSRYCMKCGYLNPSHPENKELQSYMNKNGMEGYNVGDGVSAPSIQVNVNEVRGGAVNTSFGNHMGNFTICFIINFILWILLVIGVFFGYYTLAGGNISMMLSSELSYTLVGISLFSIFQYSVQLTYMKMNKHWITALIPLVNLYMLSDAIYGKKLLNLLVFVPVVGQIYLLVLLYKLGESFKVSKILTVLFPFIMIPLMGFGSNAFKGICYVNGKDSLEKDYTKKKFYLVTCIVVFVFGLVTFIYANTVNINKGIDRLSSYYLYFASQRVIRRTKLKVENHVYDCDTRGNVLYFHFKSLSDYFDIPFYVYRDPIEAYVKVVITEEGSGLLDSYDYYISMTDGKYGYSEVNVNDLKIENITEYTELDSAYKKGHQCYFNRSA